MLRYILLILFVVIIHNTNAQKLKKHTESYGKFKEVYYADKKTKFRNGESFVINTETKDTLSRGNYENGKRVGKWTFRQGKSGVDYMIYDYSSDSLLYLNQKLVADTFLVKTANGFEVEKVDRPAIYIGYTNEIQNELTKQILNVDQMRRGLQGMLIMTYRIDTLGNLSGAKVIMELDKSIVMEIDRSIHKLPGSFLPAIRNGKPVESAIYVRLNVIKMDDPQDRYVPLAPAAYVYDILCQYGVSTRIVEQKVIRRM